MFKADDKIDNVILDKKECTYSTLPTPCTFAWTLTTTSTKSEAENMGDALNYLEDGMALEVVFYDGKAISVELPTSVEREITWTEPAVKGDTSGKVLKPAKIATGFEVAVPPVRERRRQDRNRHPHRRIPQARLRSHWPLRQPPHSGVADHKKEPFLRSVLVPVCLTGANSPKSSSAIRSATATRSCPAPPRCGPW